MADRKNILLRLDPAVYGRLPRNVGDLPRRGRPPKNAPPSEDDGVDPPESK